MSAVTTFLYRAGFLHVYKPHPYLQRFQLHRLDHPRPYTVDVYKAQRWGLGFRACGREHNPTLLAARLFHAIVDGKGTAYFEQCQGGPPWQACENANGIVWGVVGRRLWRSGSTKMLTCYLLLKGRIRPDVSMVLLNLFRRIAFRLRQVQRKSGLEVALIGVDGTGKTSIARALRSLPTAVEIIYMGNISAHPELFCTSIMRMADKYSFPRPFRALVESYELFVRRLSGWSLSRRGRVVIYDRHPAEHLEPHPSCIKHFLWNIMHRIFTWRVDLTFWLTGDYVALYDRKRELAPAALEKADQYIGEVLRRYAIPFQMIDVSRHDLPSVVKLIGPQVLSHYRQRASVDNIPDDSDKCFGSYGPFMSAPDLVSPPGAPLPK